jgi:ribonuclease P protein component
MLTMYIWYCVLFFFNKLSYCKLKEQLNKFSKAEHLKSSKAIDALFNKGKSFFIKPYKVFYNISSIANSTTNMPNAVNAQVGFAASTRNFKHAVDRNRVKRLGREAYRTNKHQLAETLGTNNMQLQVFFVYTDKVLPNYKLVEEIIKKCLNKLATTVENNSSKTIEKL